MTGAWRPEPKQGITAYQTYAIRALPGVHTRTVSCREAGCQAYERGWKTTVDISTPLGKEQARYIENESGRRYEVLADLASVAGMATYIFPAGQECFAEHQEQVRPGLYLKRAGDHRGNPTGERTEMSERSWLDDFGEHQQKLSDLQKRG